MPQAEVVRAVADWLGQDVNTRISGVPVDPGELPPPPIAAYVVADRTLQTPTPNDLAIFDESRHLFAAMGQEPPAGSTPALYLWCRTALVMEGEPTPDGQIRKSRSPVQVSVMYIARNSVRQDAIRDGTRTLRAVARSLRELSKNQNDMARQRNGIYLVLGEGPMVIDPIVSSIGKATCAGVLTVGYYVRDMTPSY
jgi:hypothetical protein